MVLSFLTFHTERLVLLQINVAYILIYNVQVQNAINDFSELQDFIGILTAILDDVTGP